MKKVLLLILISFVTVSVQAQLSDTKWTGTLQLEDPFEIVFEFKKDTLEVNKVADNSSVESMKYSIQDSVITLQKIEGQSDCGSSAPATYKFAVKEDQLHFTLISDDCADRSSVLDNSKWKKTN
jgi:hypothetical protein